MSTDAEEPRAAARELGRVEGDEVAWPLDLDAFRYCAGASEVCSRARLLQPALIGAANFLERFPEEELRFDAAVGLNGIRATVDGGTLRRAQAAALRVADRDPDHSHRGFWDPEFRPSREAVLGWDPHAASRRVNTNSVLSEALYCDRYGMRPALFDYIEKRMRDGGGYRSAHALWALAIARDRGCLSSARGQALLRSLQRELRANQPETVDASNAQAVDLYAERLLMLLLSADRSRDQRRWIAQLLDAQQENGGWGGADSGEPAYYRYHATMTVAWAMSEWIHEAGTTATVLRTGGEE
jgi:hypothetical protein